MIVVVIHGNLCRDPEVRQLANTSVCNCTIADNRKFKDAQGTSREEVTFVDLEIWGARGEAFARYHKKGARALLSGRLKQENWDDKATGQKRSKLKMVVEDWGFAASGSEGSGSAGTSSPTSAEPSVGDDETAF